jgi:hypothetical protein
MQRKAPSSSSSSSSSLSGCSITAVATALNHHRLCGRAKQQCKTGSQTCVSMMRHVDISSSSSSSCTSCGCCGILALLQQPLLLPTRRAFPTHAPSLRAVQRIILACMSDSWKMLANVMGVVFCLGKRKDGSEGEGEDNTHPREHEQGFDLDQHQLFLLSSFDETCVKNQQVGALTLAR